MAGAEEHPPSVESGILVRLPGTHLPRRFSSGLFPFSVFRWPEQTVDLAKFYPGGLGRWTGEECGGIAVVFLGV